MSDPLPFGAWKILDARKRGKKPADMVLVSFIGKLPNELNPVVHALPGAHHDWSWVRGLIVCFWTDRKQYEPLHVIECSRCHPKAMYLWDCSTERGYNVHVLPTVESIDRPQSQWEMRIHADRWMECQERRFAMGEIVWPRGA